MTGTDYTIAVARWLVEQTGSHHQLAELAPLVQRSTPGRDAELEVLRAAAMRLDLLGFIVYYHHTPPAVAVAHREGLRRLAAGEPLREVAQDVERARPVTILRTASGQWAAWYRSPLRLPVGATTAAAGAALGPDPNTALAALRERVTAQLGDPPDQMLTRQ